MQVLGAFALCTILLFVDVPPLYKVAAAVTFR